MPLKEPVPAGRSLKVKAGGRLDCHRYRKHCRGALEKFASYSPCGPKQLHLAATKINELIISFSPGRALTTITALARVGTIVGLRPRDRSVMSKNLRGSRFDEQRKGGGAAFDPKKFLAKVGDGKTIADYQKGQIVFAQGGVADAVFYLQKGRVNITVVSEQGKEAVVGILETGHFFGEGCLNGHPLRLTTATAASECVITRITKAAMIATMHNEPEFSEMFMAYLLTRNSRIEEDLIDQLFNSSEKRLARLLLLLANFGKDGRTEPVIGKFSQETLAEMIGTTRSRVSFFMNKFRKLGYIDYNGKLEIHNSLLNVVLYDNPEIKTKNTGGETK
jgi:CRP/FNR family transcriptional regulator, cyclic AMP receptor protein